LIIFGISFGLALVLTYSLSKEILTVVAEGDLSFYDSPNWKHGSTPMAIVKNGATVPVIACVDTKSDLILQADLEGRSGFISDGPFKIRRKRASIIEAWVSPYATLSCRRCYENRTR
jgi:hypothetical protein